MDQSSGYCQYCQEQVLVTRETPNHVLHFLITIFTCGLWIFAWAFVAIVRSFDPWLCTRCGQRVG